MRNSKEIIKAEEELFDKIWINRHIVLRYGILTGQEIAAPHIWAKALKESQRIIEKYGLDNLIPKDDFEWGMWNGKFSTLRWINGDEWDNFEI